MKQKYRGDGTTTKQMLSAPIGAYYVWCSPDLYYPKDLARKLNREDLVIVFKSFFDPSSERYRGRRYTGIIVDHATTLDRETYYIIETMRRI